MLVPIGGANRRHEPPDQIDRNQSTIDERSQLPSVIIVNISGIELVLTRPDVGSANRRELLTIYLHARTNPANPPTRVTPIPVLIHYLPRTITI